MSKEQQFWDWFKENEAKYYFLNQIEDADEKERLLDELLEHLHAFCDQLFFQVGGLPNDKQDLIITAEGNPDFFDTVESLVKEAPHLNYWNIIALKPAKQGGSVKYNGIELDPKAIFFDPLDSKASEKIGLRLYVSSYNPNNKMDFLTAAYWLLDNILGERSCAQDIGYVDMECLRTIEEREELIELTKLPQYIKWKKSKSTT